MAVFKSKMPEGEDLSPQMIAYLQRIEKQSNTDQPFDVAPVVPGDTSVAVTTAAISDASLPSGTVHNYVSWDGTAASARDSFGTMAFYITAIRADLLASQAAVAELSARVTALENKDNEIITALTPS